MHASIIERFRRSLQTRRDNLRQWRTDGHPDHERCLGGCPEDDVSVIDRIDAAIDRCESGDLGKCDRCEGDVEIERLRLDFTTRICLSHYSESQLKVLERDLELAAQLQRDLFPRFVPAIDFVEIAAHVRPARAVGGDYYDFFPFADMTQGIVVADVMGKGLAASMLMSNLQASIRILGPQYESPSALLTRLNELFRYNVAVTNFISIFVVQIVPGASSLRYSNGGHNPALLLKGADSNFDLLGPSGPALGLIHEPTYATHQIAFDAGDLLLLYTDGVSEMRDARGGEFGIERIKQSVSEQRGRSAVRVVDSLRERLQAFSGGVPHDDTTLLAIRKMQPSNQPQKQIGLVGQV